MNIFKKLSYKNLEIKLNKFSDKRGEFIKIFNNQKNFNIEQINISRNIKKGTIRGIHFQKKPFEDGKFVYCLRGKIFDVVVDLRKNSKNFKKWKAYTLHPKKNTIVYVPRGFGHAFQTLSNCTEVLYIHDNIYSKKYEDGINYLDESLKIRWPLKVSNISARDKCFLTLNEKNKM